MLKIFVDESGDLGMNNGYFIIVMLIAYDSKRLKNLVKNFCAKNILEEIHACKLNFVEKQKLINSLVKRADYSVSYIVADKMMINKKELFKHSNLLFNYLFSFLVKDVFQSNVDDIHLYLDNRTQKVASINSLIDYIRIKAYTDWGFTKELKLEYHNSKECKAVQVADLVASAVRRKYVYGKDDFYNRLNIIKSTKFPKNLFRLSI